jgi:Excalibur calcium-binding domain
MKRILLGILIGGAGVYAYDHMGRPAVASEGLEVSEEAEPAAASKSEASRFQCDGRQYCSQMTSCKEAMFFLENCPNVKMDGEGDGVPCERQWCGSL